MNKETGTLKVVNGECNNLQASESAQKRPKIKSNQDHRKRLINFEKRIRLLGSITAANWNRRTTKRIETLITDFFKYSFKLFAY